MRTNKFFKTGLLLFVASLGLISCGDMTTKNRKL